MLISHNGAADHWLISHNGAADHWLISHNGAADHWRCLFFFAYVKNAVLITRLIYIMLTGAIFCYFKSCKNLQLFADEKMVLFLFINVLFSS